jgi:hypothetical protein
MGECGTGVLRGDGLTAAVYQNKHNTECGNDCSSIPSIVFIVL